MGPGVGPGRGLGYFLLPAGGALSLTGVVTGSGTLISLSWIMWVLGILLVLGNRYRRPADPRELAAAAAAGDARAVRRLRTLALTARAEGRPDTAERLLRQAVKAGDTESMWELGRLVEQREGLAAARPWFRMAAERGHAVAKRLFRPGGALHPDGAEDPAP
ncbi:MULTISPECIES: SEL1-like repeat protein [unclassified Streptomyces]|uniref:sel1 repeat family protein n=1 Tax=unclassified Streptomyces TaxID=2593676 RepID=UPI0009328722|nr:MULTISPECIES: sel1 repeat family protein [unclassified Streptomyces]QWQ42957.1 sel1 repeat family protein [Streptomyces sp. YPW6]